jgi:fucose permease
MSTDKQSMFVTKDGKNVLFTFIIVSSLFLLWGFCNGMIDVMDKHFQDELKLSLSQSAWVQFAHWMGYFLMSLPAGWLAVKLGYKGGIIAGLLLVAVGGFWFIPATKIAAFWAFLLGVCVVASGLTFLETVANPYTTVLGPPRYAATRINLAQSCNGVGWVFGPIAGGLFFYSKDASGQSTGSETLWIPYAGVAVVVLILAAIFYFSPVPDIKAEDDYHMDDNTNEGKPAAAKPDRVMNRGWVFGLLLANVTVLIGIFGMIFWLALDSLDFGSRLVGLASAIPRPASLTVTPENAILIVLTMVGVLAVVVAAAILARTTKRLSHHSVWAHEHFSGATLAQFFYVAAQAGIFSFLINYMTSEPPSLPASWLTESTSRWIEVRTAFTRSDIKDLPAFAEKLKQKPDAVSAFLSGELSSNAVTARLLTDYQGAASDPEPLARALARDLNQIVKQDPKKVEAKRLLYDDQRFSGISLSAKTRQLLADQAANKKISLAELNRRLLQDAYPKELAFNDSILGISDKVASFLASFGFICFLIGRITGAAWLRRVSAHRIVGLYGVVNVVMCLLVFFKLGWLSVVCVFLSYFFMSIMFPTIFALGIFGLGARAKGASAYIVMGIVGGAMLPKLMGAVADHYDMSRGFIVPVICFVLIALYGYCWPKLSRAESLHGVGATSGH